MLHVTAFPMECLGLDWIGLDWNALFRVDKIVEKKKIIIIIINA